MLGSVGAGRGAMAGNVKGGIGSASISLSPAITVGALVAANPVGSVYFPDGKTFYAAPWACGDELGVRPLSFPNDDHAPFPPCSRFGAGPRESTTLAIVATNAAVTRVEAKRIAVMAQDGIARAIRPAHTPFDGDIVFAVSTSSAEINETDTARALIIAQIGALAADCLARAIARAVFEATENS